MTQSTPSELELAALLCSRVCHDVISPVGAITNGLEVLQEDGAEDMHDFAMDLIRKSATQASAKLQFARIAFGASGSAGAHIDLGDAQQVAINYMESEKANLIWTAPRLMLAKNRVKLLMNLLLIATGAIPRGGDLTIEAEGEEETVSFSLTATGMNARIPAGIEDLIAGKGGEHGVDAHAIQPFYAGMLARNCKMEIKFEIDGETVKITAARA